MLGVYSLIRRYAIETIFLDQFYFIDPEPVSNLSPGLNPIH